MTLAVPTPRTWVDGETPTAAIMNDQIKAFMSLALDPPRIRVRNSATQTIPNNTAPATVAVFDTEDRKVDIGHSTVTNPSRLIVATPGDYFLAGQYGCAAHAAGARLMRWAKNGTPIDVQVNYIAINASASYLAPTILVSGLVAGDYIELLLGQSSGAALNANPGSPNLTAALMWWAGR